MKYQNLTIGCDPEFFLKGTDGFIGAFNFLKGTKWKPENIDDLGSAVLHDNVMVEFNTQPAHNSDEFVASINKVLSHLRGRIPADIEFSFLPSAHFEKNKLRSRAARTFGCEPDFNAWWKGMVNPSISCADPTLRTSGGHIHVGFDDVTKEKQIELITHMDLYLGVPSILMDTGGAERRLMYGKAGAFRPKPYGAEYRVLSNFWIQSDILKEWAFMATKRCTDDLNSGFAFTDVNDIDSMFLAINENNVDAAKFLVEKYNLPMV